MPMHDRGPLHPETTGSALLDAAQRALVDGLLPHLAPEHRTLARMIASAMRMAAREFEQEQALAAGRVELRALLAAAPGDSPDEGRLEVERSDRATTREGILAIREGRFDADPRLHALLWADAAVRASVAKPSSLTRVERRLAGLPESDDGAPA